MFDLSKVPNSVLLKELRKRKFEKSSSNGKDWYFFQDDEDECMFIYFVHKRFWHVNQYVHDVHITKHLKGKLPKGFVEVEESAFEYSGYWNSGREKLLNYGFTELDDRKIYGIFQRYVVKCKGHKFDVKLNFDSSEIMDDFFVKFGTKDFNIEVEDLSGFFEQIIEASKKINCTFIKADGAYTIISTEVYNNLPEELISND